MIDDTMGEISRNGIGKLSHRHLGASRIGFCSYSFRFRGMVARGQLCVFLETVGLTLLIFRSILYPVFSSGGISYVR